MKTKLLGAMGVLAALGLFGCVTEPVLVPGAGAQIASGSETVAYAARDGVQVWVDGAAWAGTPVNLAELMTPINVTLENHTQQPLRVAYADFALVGASGFRYPAMPPLPGQKAVSSAEPAAGLVVLADFHPRRHALPPPRFHPRGFYIAPHFHYWWPGALVWNLTFPYDPAYYGRWNWPAPLPSDDMLALALPEGVLQVGGRVQGFVYFQGVASRERRVSFELNLVNASDGQAFGKLEVPLAVRME